MNSVGKNSEKGKTLGKRKKCKLNEILIKTRYSIKPLIELEFETMSANISMIQQKIYSEFGFRIISYKRQNLTVASPGLYIESIYIK